MADAVGGRIKALLYVREAGGTVVPVQYVSGSLPVQIQSSVAAATIDVRQRTPPVTALLSSTGAVSVGAVAQPNTNNRAFQVIKTGGGDLTHILEASLDPVATSSPADAVWITLMTSTASEGTATNVPWRYVRSRISAVSGSARCAVFMCA